jgi:hypothetical protein
MQQIKSALLTRFLMVTLKPFDVSFRQVNLDHTEGAKSYMDWQSSSYLLAIVVTILYFLLVDHLI